MTSASFSSPTAPTAPPDNLKVTHNDSRSAYLTWNPPPPRHHNGVLTGYLVEVVSVSNPQLVQHEETDVYTTEISISSLKPWTAYVFKVGAKTAGGVGLQASEQSTTPEGGIALLFIHGKALLAFACVLTCCMSYVCCVILA